MDCSPPGSSVHGILQARILQWVAISSSRGIFPTQGSNPGLPHCRQTLYNLRHQRSPVYTVLPYREAYIWFLFPHLSPTTQILFECSLALLLVSCVFILYCLFSSFLFIFFKLCSYGNTFTEELGKYRTKLRIVPLYITIIFWVGKLKFFIGVLISNSQKLIE